MIDQTKIAKVLQNLVLWGFLIISLFMLAIAVSEIITICVGDSSNYPFGWEGGGIVYSTKEHYLFFALLTTLISGFTISSFFLKRKYPKLFSAVATISVCYYLLYYLVLNPVFLS